MPLYFGEVRPQTTGAWNLFWCIFSESSDGRALPSAPSRLLCLGMAVNSSCYVIILSNGDGSAVGIHSVKSL